MARRKVKNGEKSPWWQCFTSPVPNGFAFWLGGKTQNFSSTSQKSERRRPFGTGLVRHYCPQGLFSPFFTFLRAIFFRPFRLSLAPTICPWVSEDEFGSSYRKKNTIVNLSAIVADLSNHWSSVNLYPGVLVHYRRLDITLNMAAAWSRRNQSWTFFVFLDQHACYRGYLSSSGGEKYLC